MWVRAPSLVRKIAREKCPFLTNCDMCFLFVLETDPIPHSQDLDAVLKFYWVLYWMRRESELFLLSGFNSRLFIVRVEDERQERRKKAVKWGLQENRRGSEKRQDGSVLWWKQNIQLRVQSHSFPNSSEKERNKLNTSNTILPWNTNTYYTPSLSKHRANSQICVLELCHFKACNGYSTWGVQLTVPSTRSISAHNPEGRCFVCSSFPMLA